MLTNHAGVSIPFSHSNHNFDKLFAKRAFVQHYTLSNLQEGEFSDARNETAFLVKDYWEPDGDYGYGEEEEYNE